MLLRGWLAVWLGVGASRLGLRGGGTPIDPDPDGGPHDYTDKRLVAEKVVHAPNKGLCASETQGPYALDTWFPGSFYTVSGIMELTGVQWVLAVVALFALVFGPSGAAAIAVKSALNGARADIRKTAATCERMETKLNATATTVAVLEERSGDHERRINRLENAA